jgi:hypothetical protein
MEAERLGTSVLRGFILERVYNLGNYPAVKLPLCYINVFMTQFI